MDVSIVIVSWNVRELLTACLASIKKETKQVRYEVIVVDNASHDGSSVMVKEKFPWVKLIANQVNQGFSRANNQALSFVSGEAVLFLNPDTKIIDGAIDKSVQYLKRQPNIGVLGCRILNPDYTIQPSVRRFPNLKALTLVLLKLHHLFPRSQSLNQYLCHDFNYLEASTVDQVMGAFFLVPHRILNLIGPFDESFWIWFEEVDFCQRVKSRGYEVQYWPKAQIIHHHAQSFTQLLSLKKQLYFNKSLITYFKKHRPISELVGLFLLQPFSLLASLLIHLAPRKNDGYPQIGGS